MAAINLRFSMSMYNGIIEMDGYPSLFKGWAKGCFVSLADTERKEKMCIDSNGICKSCGREFDDLAEHSVCPSDDCPSNNEVKAKELWDRLGDIPVNESDEIEEPFLHFLAGADKFEIWQWFEEEFDLSVAKDLMKVG